MIPRYSGFDPDGVAETEADHFGNWPGLRGAYLEMRDLDQVLAHVHAMTLRLRSVRAQSRKRTSVRLNRAVLVPRYRDSLLALH
jgi:hypothetical protein